MFEDWSEDLPTYDDESVGQTPVTPTGGGLDQRLLDTLAAHEGRGGIYPRVPRLAELLGVSDRTVQRHLADLEAAGLVERVPVFERDNDPEWQRRGHSTSHARRQTSNTYRLLVSPGPGDTEQANVPAQTPVTPESVSPLEEKEQPASEEREVSSSRVSSPLTVVEVGQQHPADLLDHDPTAGQVLAALAPLGSVEVVAPVAWQGRRPVYRAHKGARPLPLARDLEDFHAAVDALDQDTVPESYARKVNGHSRALRVASSRVT